VFSFDSTYSVHKNALELEACNASLIKLHSKELRVRLLQNISKNQSKKVDVFVSKLRPNRFADHLLLIFCNGGSSDFDVQ
jgi:hypothetical protein